MAEFKPNIYPIMYWALAFGIVAGLGLYLLQLLAQFITIIWVPVFLAGMAWGAYRNYKTQQAAWSKNNGVPIAAQSPMNEFKQAFRDIRDSSQELLAQQQTVPPEQLPVDDEALPVDESEIAPEPQTDLTPEEVAAPETAPDETIQTIEEVPPTPPQQPPQPPQSPAV